MQHRIDLLNMLQRTADIRTLHLDPEANHPFRVACHNGDTNTVENHIKNNTLPEEISICMEEASSYGHTDVVKILLNDSRFHTVSSLGSGFYHSCIHNYTAISDLILNDPKVSLFKLGTFCFDRKWFSSIEKLIQHPRLQKQDASSFIILKKLIRYLPTCNLFQKSLMDFDSNQLISEIKKQIIKDENTLKLNMEADYISNTISKERASEMANQTIREMKSTLIKNSSFAANFCHIFACRKDHDSKLPPELWEKIAETAVTTTISSGMSDI